MANKKRLVKTGPAKRPKKRKDEQFNPKPFRQSRPARR